MNVIFKLSSPSSGRSGDLLEILPRRDYLLTIRHEDTDDELRFAHVEALCVTYHHACTTDMIARYDRVTDLGETPWLAATHARLLAARESADGLRHLALYLDDGPHYELICRGFGAVTTKVA